MSVVPRNQDQNGQGSNGQVMNSQDLNQPGLNKQEIVRRLIILLIIAGVSVFLDQITKQWAIDNLKGEPTRYYLGGLLQLLYATNEGAFGSLGSSWPDDIRFWALTVGPILFLLIFTVHVLLSRQYSRFEFYAFTLIIGGGIGNLIDRARFQYVVDFLYMGMGKIGTNIFNIADFIIVIGFVMMVWQWGRTWRAQNSKAKQSPT